ncbi:unnamed protein product [Paramecium sonneborni]|uniref:protein-tyrosine-phosphatase n=1 Tax=Paramecium sonneborni TaxID=65129 RepID=A0A8S1P906_9CILI|nr:unnamed protein product [Paramecium sonneborni]
MFRMFDPMYQSMNQILEENGNILWLGDCTAAYDRNLLDGRGIKTVLTVAAGLNVSYPEGGIVHKVYHILDIESANIARLFGDTCHQIGEGLKRGGVLVHCAAGVSRSASAVIAYIMKTTGLNFQEAFTYVRKRRSVVFPNYGFQRQLRNYEKDLKQLKLKEPQAIDIPIKQTQKKPQEIPMDKHEQFSIQYLEQKAKLLLKPVQGNPTFNSGYSTPQKQFQKQRMLYQSAKVGSQEPKQNSITQNSTRANSQFKNNNFEPSFNQTYQGPQIVTYQRNKIIEKMPDIKKKTFYK